jgi:hypothetical protein
MLKNDLNEQGYSVTEHYQKHGKVTLIWVILAIILIATVLVTTVIINNMSNPMFDFFDNIAQSINSVFRTHGATSVIYLLIWVGIFIVSCYFARNFSDEQKISRCKQWKIITIWVLVILALAAIFFFIVLIADNYNVEDKPAAFFGFFEGMYIVFFWISEELTRSLGALGALGGYGAIFAYLVVFVLWYLALKLIATIFVCSDKHRSIKLKILKMNAMPICHCKEALKLFPTVLIYLMPAAFMYSMIYILSLRSSEAALNIFTIIFMTFYITFDLTAVLYALFFKIRHQSDYIAVNYHIYEMTLYSKTYV